MTHGEIVKADNRHDPYLLISTLLLMAIGIIMVYSASSMIAMKRFDSHTYFFNRQVIHVLIALMTLAVFRYVPYRIFRPSAYPLLGIAFVLLIALYLPGVGRTVGGARRWMTLFGLSFQPAEFARLALIIYLANSMYKKQEKIKSFSIGFLPHFLLFGGFAALILFQPDFGMVAMIAVIGWIMLFVGGVRLSHLSGALLVLFPLAYYILTLAGYRLQRIASFIDPWKYQNDAGYQIVHSLMAFGSGGVLGSGIGNGYQKLFYLPEPHTDFIFSVVGEELGLVGIGLVISLYAVVVWRGTRIAMTAKDLFATFLATGLTATLGLQACINIAVSMGLLPTKGLTLPLMSYGGTSMVINAMAVGILMNISAQQMPAPRLRRSQ
jgi:cell division protein FtsW